MPQPFEKRKYRGSKRVKDPFHYHNNLSRRTLRHLIAPSSFPFLNSFRPPHWKIKHSITENRVDGSEIKKEFNQVPLSILKRGIRLDVGVVFAECLRTHWGTKRKLSSIQLHMIRFMKYLQQERVFTKTKSFSKEICSKNLAINISLD